MKRIIATVLCIIFALAIPCNAGMLDFLKSPEEKLKDKVQLEFSQYKQVVFGKFHPVGTATSVTVHGVEIAWRNNRPLSNPEGAAAYRAMFTIYWRGPIVSDGFTKGYAVFDNDSKRYVKWEVISTNGITNTQAADAAIDFATGFMEGYNQSQR